MVPPKKFLKKTLPLTVPGPLLRLKKIVKHASWQLHRSKGWAHRSRTEGRARNRATTGGDGGRGSTGGGGKGEVLDDGECVVMFNWLGRTSHLFAMIKREMKGTFYYWNTPLGQSGRLSLDCIGIAAYVPKPVPAPQPTL